QKLLTIASERSGAMKVVSSRNPFCLRRIGRISSAEMRLSSVAEFAFNFKVTCRPNICFSSVVELLTSGDLENSRGAEKGVSDSIRRSPYANDEYMSNTGYIAFIHYLSWRQNITQAKHIISGLHKCAGAQTAALSSRIPIYEPHCSIQEDRKTDD